MKQTDVLILGIGNLLWADEGFGVRAVEALNRYYHFPQNVRLMDGGTQGIYLVPYVQQADVLIVFDAVDYGLAPGTLKIVRDGEVPKFMGAKKMSLHQTGFQEVLAMAELLGDYPQKLLLIGVQPVELEDYGGSLRAPVKACIEPALDIALEFLRDLGIVAAERRQPLDSAGELAPASLAITSYETQRPDDSEACRSGDARILQSPAFHFEPKSVTAEPLNLSVDIDQRGRG
ncbi:HyaD/HybD family hydrogenase maturation endopeptidase [Exilibacterium tricleocarpae]|uniref:HyaD/HybD family hydrogenase maturation endopeptidase n=2 Tax=Exilibacterium tricleocarpae TaxID=2591008 RepID=A0A545TFS4_9GAMM|nr:HyaD/HybD family hydrogenase maturation endopeptidase [Exilibacterium tricleocarpae]